MVIALGSGTSDLHLSPDRDHYVAFLARHFESHIVSLHPDRRKYVPAN